MSRLQSRIVLAALAALHVIADVIAIPTTNQFESLKGLYAALLVAGAILGQVSMLAAYLAWGGGHWIIRWCLALLGVTALWCAITCGALFTGESYPLDSVPHLFQLSGFACTACLFTVPVTIPGCRFALTRNLSGRSAVSLVAGTLFLLLIESVVVSLFFAGQMSGALPFVGCFHLGVIGEVVASSLVARACGFRLV